MSLTALSHENCHYANSNRQEPAIGPAVVGSSRRITISLRLEYCIVLGILNRGFPDVLIGDSRRPGLGTSSWTGCLPV